MILLGAACGVGDPVLTIAACLSYRSPFLVVGPKLRMAAAKARGLFALDSFSDHITVWRCYLQWRLAGDGGGPPAQQAFCRTHFLSHATLTMIDRIKVQLTSSLAEMGIRGPEPKGGQVQGQGQGQGQGALKKGGQAGPGEPGIELDTSFAQAVVAASLEPNIASINYLRKAGKNGGPSKTVHRFFTPEAQENLKIHPSSCNGQKPASFAFPGKFLVYFELVRTSQLFARETAVRILRSLLLLQYLSARIKKKSRTASFGVL
jgi:hypothetical protein